MYEDLHKKINDAGQGHLLKYWDSLTDSEKQELAQELKGLDFFHLENLFRSSMSHNEATSESQATYKPWRDVITIDSTRTSRAAHIRAGLDLISSGGLAVLLLAGGQGTRLGSSLPKGCYDIGLPSHKSLFHLHAERIRNVELLARAWIQKKKQNESIPVMENASSSSSPAPSASSIPQSLRPSPPPDLSIPWLIMTSPFTHAETVAHFAAHSFFGLKSSQVLFFQQDGLPCFDPNGKLILQTPFSLARAPDGNGGLYLALRKSGMLSELSKRGVQAVDCFCVDNALARPADPEMVGACWIRKTKCGSRTVARVDHTEKVGVFAEKRGKGDDAEVMRGGSLAVLEYSELPPTDATAYEERGGGEGKGEEEKGKEEEEKGKEEERVDKKTGKDKCKGAKKLKYNWANICMHYFTLDFLNQVADRLDGTQKNKNHSKNMAHAKDANDASNSDVMLLNKESTMTAMPYHVARKNIPAAGSESVAGIKLELFIFDVFFMAGQNTTVVEIDRATNFAPVKNAPGSATDSPDTARESVKKLHEQLSSILDLHLASSSSPLPTPTTATVASTTLKRAREEGESNAEEGLDSEGSNAVGPDLKRARAVETCDSDRSSGLSGSNDETGEIEDVEKKCIDGMKMNKEGLERLIEEKLKQQTSLQDISDSDLEILVEAIALTEWD